MRLVNHMRHIVYIALIKNIKNKSIGNRHMYFYDKRDENAYKKFIKK